MVGNRFDSLTTLVAVSILWGGLYGLGPIRRELNLTATKEDELLRDDEGGSVLLVQVEVSVGHRRVARDRGVLGCSNGALYFSGHSFSFLIGSQDLERRWRIWPAMTVPEARLLGIRHPSKHVTIQIRALYGRSRPCKYAHHMLVSGLRSFRRQPPTTVERQYPPLEPYRSDRDG
jgi:hypothetical protein